MYKLKASKKINSVVMMLMNRREEAQRLRGTQTNDGVKTECRRQAVPSFNSLSESTGARQLACV